jgi:hypothetical protein
MEQSLVKPGHFGKSVDNVKIIKNFVEKFTPELVDHYHVTNTVV